MKAYAIILIALIFLVSLSCQQQPAALTDAQKTEIEKEVRAVLDQWISALDTLDYTQQLQWYSKEEFWGYIGNGQAIPTTKALFDSMQNWFSVRVIQKVEMKTSSVKAISSDRAIVYFTTLFEHSFKEGKTVKGHSAETIVFKKESQGWRIIHEHESWTDIQ
jgi:ketosteroid isomerase-like protein